MAMKRKDIDVLMLLDKLKKEGPMAAAASIEDEDEELHAGVMVGNPEDSEEDDKDAYPKRKLPLNMS